MKHYAQSTSTQIYVVYIKSANTVFMYQLNPAKDLSV